MTVVDAQLLEAAAIRRQVLDPDVRYPDAASKVEVDEFGAVGHDDLQSGVVEVDAVRQVEESQVDLFAVSRRLNVRLWRQTYARYVVTAYNKYMTYMYIEF